MSVPADPLGHATGTRGRLGVVVTSVLSLGGPLTLLTALLYYIGSVSARSYYSYFGVSLSALDLSTTDFIIRSSDTLFRPLATLVVAVIALLLGHQLLSAVLGHLGPTPARHAVLGVVGTGVLLAAVGMLGLYGQPFGIWSPLALAAAALVLEYGAWLASRHLALSGGAAAVVCTAVDLRRGLVAALVVLAAFWAATGLAQARGETEARVVEATLRLQPQAVVYSAEDLHLPADRGIGTTELKGPRSAYDFQYNGLRPLIRSDGRWFLLPVLWRHGNDTTVVVLDDDPGRLRVDLAPSRPPPP